MARLPLMPVDEALEKILSHAKLVKELESVPLMQALGRVLAVDQQSSINVPPCDNSAMDGYAIRYQDLAANNNTLVISQRIPAGQMGSDLLPGTAARIFTGAAIPPLADTVVMQEDVTLVGDDAIHVAFDMTLGSHIRPRGQDIAEGSVILRRGRRLKAQDIGLLASIGVTEVPVYRRLKVAVLSTGDELVEPGEPLSEGQIYNSNRYTLSALLIALGCDVVDAGIVEDDFGATCETLRKAASEVDLIISSGGVSVGEEDHVKVAVESLGQLTLWKLNMKPGKPVAFGRVASTPFLGLPGNPSSVFVTFGVIARSYVLSCQGQTDVMPVITEVSADFDWLKVGSRQEYLRAKVSYSSGVPVASLYGNQSSGVLASTSWANALLVLKPGEVISAGDRVQVIVLSELVGI